MSRNGKGFLPDPVKAERNILIKLLLAYKENTCLWNTGDPDYNNKICKTAAKEKLLTIYKEFNPKADNTEVRKTLDNMRSSAKRYFKRKIEAKTKGEKYRCTLWYYNYIKFLYGDNDDDDDTYNVNYDPVPKPVERTMEESNLSKERILEYIDILSDNFDASSSTSFAAFQSGFSNDSTDSNEKFSISEEASVFGTSIDHQLSQVAPDQKCIAEKLILQVVDLARMNKLKPDTNISLKSFDGN